MATCHYATDVTRYLECEDIDFVRKEKNAPNVPQARGIELFWSLCKRKYKKRPEKPKSIKAFKQIWTKLSKEVAAKSGTAVMRAGLTKLKKNCLQR